MSWSKSASGTAAEVKELAAKWADEVEKIDRSYGASDAIVSGHRAQAQRCADAVTAIAKTVPEGCMVNVSAYGHTDGATANPSDQWGLKLDAYRPVAVGAGG